MYVFPLIQGAVFTLDLKICNFFTGVIDYLGYGIRPKILEIATHTMNAIKEPKPSSTFIKLFFFFETCNVLRGFVPSFAQIAAPISDLPKKYQSKYFCALTPAGLGTMHKLQEKQVSLPILALLNSEWTYKFDTGACNVQVWCLLL